jgi:hypothetical protein
LEPSPQDHQFSSSSSRGGRGFHRQSNWSQVKGDKEAIDSFRNMRNAETDTQGLAEFVELLKMRFVVDDAAAAI